ncbi:MAG: protein translocase subunit SecD [Epsilonproteobacteria bacterium]|nr:protein translocase subunit SecD [Campylobacterota bacterium]
MMKISYRLVIFILALLFGIAFSIPTFTNSKGPKVKLGLDLQGGMYLLLGVKTDEAIKSKLKVAAATIRYIAQKNELYTDDITTDGNSIKFTLLDKDDEKKMDEQLKILAGFKITKQKKDDEIIYTLTLTKKEIEATKQNAIEQAIQTIRSRLNAFGLSEPSVTKQGKDKIVVELPGIKTKEEADRARKLISTAAHLELMEVDTKHNPTTAQEAKKYGDKILLGQNGRKYVVKELPILDGSMITDARVGYNQANQAVINFTLNSQGAKIFGDWTGKHVGDYLAIVIDNKVLSAPVIKERIGGGAGQITVGDAKEAHDLAIALRSGALPAPIVLLEKRSVGPSLGADSIKASMIALASGFLLVVVFMAWYYHVAGIVANIALFANLVLIIAIMALFNATLTLPGMAGIVLTVGMAVDANVIINERIRELLREGVNIKKAIEGGYANAMSAIIDANVTTLIAAFALFAYGTGTIKGFAITMAIGILASMLTAILGTHGIWEFLEGRMQLTKKSFGLS